MSDVQNAKNELEKQKKASADAVANIATWEKQVNVLVASQKTASQAVSDVNKRISEINFTINGLRNHISQLKKQYGAKPTDSQKAEIKKQEDKITAENGRISTIKNTDLSKAQQKQVAVNNELNLARKNLTDARNAKAAADKAITAAEKAVTAAEYEQDAGVTEKFLDSLMAELTKLSMKDITEWVKKTKALEVNVQKELMQAAQKDWKDKHGVVDANFHNSTLCVDIRKSIAAAEQKAKSPGFNNEIADGIIHNKSQWHGLLNCLIGFTGSFAIPASAVNIVKTYHSKAKLAYTIASVYGSPPSGDKLKMDLYILFLGKTFFKEVLRGVQNEAAGTAKDKAKELLEAEFKSTNMYKKMCDQGNALKNELLKRLPAKLKTDAAKQIVKSAGSKMVPIAGVVLSTVSAFKDMKEFGNFCKEYYSP